MAVSHVVIVSRIWILGISKPVSDEKNLNTVMRSRAVPIMPAQHIISSARLKWVDNCGHVPHLEQVDNCVASRVL